MNTTLSIEETLGDLTSEVPLHRSDGFQSLLTPGVSLSFGEALIEPLRCHSQSWQKRTPAGKRGIVVVDGPLDLPNRYSPAKSKGGR